MPGNASPGVFPGEDAGPVAAAVMPNQFVTFSCAGRAYGLDVMTVREIRSWSPVTALPQQPFGAQGVLDIRGSTVQVFDLATLLGGSAGGDAASPVVLVVSLARVDVGLVVDAVSDIIFAAPEDLKAPPKSSRALVTALVRNEDRLVGILDLGALFPGEPEGDIV
jgi:purine-binding chemotaxis protein CheW